MPNPFKKKVQMLEYRDNVVREMLYILVIITDITISLVFTTFVK